MFFAATVGTYCNALAAKYPLPITAFENDLFATIVDTHESCLYIARNVTAVE